MAQVASSFLAGLLFALGLGLAGMSKPSKVIGFLDLSASWDPSLLFVMAGAIAVYAVAYRLTLRRSRPIAAATFHLPSKSRIDLRLLVGAALFGVGWGLGGYCPGPAVVGILTGSATTLTFVASMILGVLGHAVYRKLSAPAV